MQSKYIQIYSINQQTSISFLYRRSEMSVYFSFKTYWY